MRRDLTRIGEDEEGIPIFMDNDVFMKMATYGANLDRILEIALKMMRELKSDDKVKDLQGGLGAMILYDLQRGVNLTQIPRAVRDALPSAPEFALSGEVISKAEAQEIRG